MLTVIGLAGTSYAGKQYDITYKVNEYLPDGNSEKTRFYINLNNETSFKSEIIKDCITS